MRFERMSGLDEEQLSELECRVSKLLEEPWDPWTGSWTGSPVKRVQCASRLHGLVGICAGSALGAPGRASRNAPLAGFRLAVAPRSGRVPAGRDVASRRWVMSHTTGVFHISGVPACLADQDTSPVAVSGPPLRLPRPRPVS